MKPSCIYIYHTIFDRVKFTYISVYLVFQDYQIQPYISSLNYYDVEKCVYKTYVAA